jgi:ectoine hydroxylase-related dioxygenase (phytanoyl-CoA dioxygenase family)
MARLGLSALLLRTLPEEARPATLRAKLRAYSAPENWLWLRSLGRRFYADLPLDLDLAQARSAGANVPDRGHRLEEAERERFLGDGYLAPFRVIAEDEARALARSVSERARTPGVYGFATPRDLHLSSPEVRELFAHPAIVDRMVQLMGEDLGIWRSELFAKQPGADAIMTHHATVYRFEDRLPVLEPDEPEGLFQLTVWIALSDARIDNGCMYVIPGTHTRPVSFCKGGGDRFYGFDAITPEPSIPTRPVPIELAPGEAFIFSERVLHGSYANTSERPRIGLNARVIRPDVRVHGDKVEHFAQHHGATFDLSAWGVWPLAGVDPFGYNRQAHFPTRELATRPA